MALVKCYTLLKSVTYQTLKREAFMFLLKIVVAIKPQKRTEFLQTMNSMILTAPPEDGCRKRAVCQQHDDENVYCYMQTWDAKEKLETHVRTDRFKALLGAMQVLGEVKEMSMDTLNPAANFYEESDTLNVRRNS